MQDDASQVHDATPTKKRKNKLCPENEELVHKWIDAILKQPTKPSLHERKEIVEKIRKSDPWFQLTNLNNRVTVHWDRLHPPGTACANHENAKESQSDITNSSPTNVTVDASRAIQTLLQERPDASDMDVDSWARGLGIEEDVAKDYVKQLRVENGTASRSGSSTGAGLVEGLEVTTRTMDASNDAGTPPHTLSREPGSPQPEISTVVPQHLDTSPFIMSPGSVPYALNPKAISPFTGPFRQPVPDQESPAVSCSPVLASPSDDSTGHLHDNDTIISRAAYSHPSPSGSTHADGFDSRCRRSASPTFTSMHDLSQTGAPLDVPTTRDETPWETPAQMLDHNVGIEDNSHQLNGFTRPAKSATDEAHFAITDNFDDFAPALPILAPDENVPHRPPLSESSEMQDDADARTAADQLNSKFKPFRDAMDALILRIRAARRDQTCRTDDPST